MKGLLDIGCLTRQMGIFLRRRKPEILIGLGISGWATTTVLAVRATPEAMRRIRNWLK